MTIYVDKLVTGKKRFNLLLLSHMQYIMSQEPALK